MKKEISPVTAAIVILVVVVILGIIGWRYFFAEPAPPVIDPSQMPVGGPRMPPPGMAPGGQPGAAAPGATQGQPGAPAAPQRPPASEGY